MTSQIVIDALLKPRRSSWSVTGTSAANTAKTITKAAATNQCHYITAIDVSLSGGASGADIAIELKSDAAGTPTTYWKTYIGNTATVGTRVFVNFPVPLKLDAGKTADLVVGVGGTSCVTNLNLAGFTDN